MKAIDPRVSIVIPAFNAARFLPETLESVASQTFSDYETILVDDGSTDNTPEFAARYGDRIRYVRQAHSGGPGAPRNTGLGQCRGEYICFLDADDLMLPDRLEKQVGFLAEHPESGLVFVDYRNFSADELSDRTHFESCPVLQNLLGNRPSLVLTSEQATGLLLKENFGLPSSLMIRRGVLVKVPSFSTDLTISADFHFFYRVAREHHVGIVNRVCSLRRLHDQNISGDSIQTLHDYVASRAALRASESNAANVDLLEAFLFRCEIDLARAYSNRGNFRKALAHNLRALTAFGPVSVSRLSLGLRALVRTGAIALYLKRPGR